MIEPEEKKINKFLEEGLGKYNSISPLSGDASMRRYYRVVTDDNSYILCFDETLRSVSPESYPYDIVYKLFRSQAIPVPDVYKTSGRDGLLLIQDLGDTLLESKCAFYSGAEKKKIYSGLLDILVNIQSIPKDENLIPFRLSFDVDKLMFEFNFFIENCILKYFNARVEPGLLDELREEFKNISGILFRPEYFVLNHRDYHSRNIMLCRGDPYIIDFQDARLGLPQYDLVSLLRDSYHTLEIEELDYCKKYYYDASREKGIMRMSMDEFEYYFDLSAFQRNVKALGTFGYQVRSLNRAYFEKYIDPTIHYLKDYVSRREELKKSGRLLAVCLGGMQ